MSEKEFVVAHLVYALMIWPLYRWTLFSCLKDCTYAESRQMLLVMIAVSCVVGILLCRRHRNRWDLALNVIFGYGIYTSLIYKDSRPYMVAGCWGIALVLSTAYALVVLTNRMPRPHDIQRLLRRRMRHILYASRSLCAVGTIVIMVAAGMSVMTNSPVSVLRENETRHAEGNAQTMAANKGTLSLLREENWQALNLQERTEVLQTVADIEREYLGISHELNVTTMCLTDNILGQYTDNTHEITLDRSSLMTTSSWTAVFLVCHEAYHGYEHRLIDVANSAGDEDQDLLIFAKAHTYADEFANYDDGSEDYETYWNQACESDGRDYAESEVARFRAYVEE